MLRTDGRRGDWVGRVVACDYAENECRILDSPRHRSANVVIKVERHDAITARQAHR